MTGDRTQMVPALSSVVIALTSVALLVAKTAIGGPIPANPRYVFEPVGDEEGLATRGATSLYQDEVGFIWIGTQDGLFRYDGARVKRLTKEDGAPGAYITSILGDPAGTVWVVAEGEIARFDGMKFQPLTLDEEVSREGGITLDIPQSIAFSAAGDLFAATLDGVVQLDPETGKLIARWSEAEGLPGRVVRSVHAASDGTVWFAAGGMVGWLDPSTGQIETYDLFAAGLAEDIIAVVVNERRTVWVRTRGNLLKMEEEEDGFSYTCDGIGEAATGGMPTLDSRDRLMVPSRIGLFYETDDRWKVISARNGLSVNACWMAMEDREGGLWIGLAGSGVSRSPGLGSWYAWTAANGLPDDGVWGIMRDREGRLWVGTSGGVGIWMPDENRWRVLTREDGIFGDSVWKIIADRRGRVWSLSRRLGITRFDPETLEPSMVTLPDRYPSGPTDFALGPDGNIWVSGSDYLFKIVEEGEDLAFIDIDYPDDLTGCMEVIAVATDGTVWTGGRNGLGRLSGGEWNRYTTADGLVSNRVEYLAAESGEAVWVDNRGAVGVTRFELGEDGPSIRRVTSRDGLISDTVFLLEMDRDGRVWVGTADGLSVIERDGSLRNFDTGDGLIWNDISQGGFLSEADGGVFVGTGRGLAYSRYRDQTPVEAAPNIVITSAMLGGQEQLLETGPKVSFGDGTFVASYSCLVFRDASSARFRYRLLGLESEYFESRQREVRYPALRAGSYTFEVTCGTASGGWSEKPATFSFSVDPPWWDSWWARLGGASLVVLIVFLILEFRTRKLERDRRRLEAAVAQRSAQLAEANRELREMSFTDALTHVRNRRFFYSVIDADVSTTLRNNDPRFNEGEERNRDLIFYMVDIDFFKRVNDVLGHMAGDRVLEETARRLEKSIRQSDLLVRWGGEEFLIVCRGAHQEEGSMVTRRVLDLIGEEPFEVDGCEPFRRTCSVGWAAFPAHRARPEAIPYEAVIELADRALYVAKGSGRNRGVGVEIIEDPGDREDPRQWLSDPLEELDGKHVRLTVVEGPAPTPDPDPEIG